MYQFDPRHFWHHYIRDNHVYGFLFQQCQGFQTVTRRYYPYLLVSQELPQYGPIVGLILHDQHGAPG